MKKRQEKLPELQATRNAGKIFFRRDRLIIKERTHDISSFCIGNRIKNTTLIKCKNSDSGFHSVVGECNQVWSEAPWAQKLWDLKGTKSRWWKWGKNRKKNKTTKKNNEISKFYLISITILMIFNKFYFVTINFSMIQLFLAKTISIFLFYCKVNWCFSLVHIRI